MCYTTLCEIQPMSQQDASKIRPYRGLVLDTRAVVSLTVSKLCQAHLHSAWSKNQRAVLPRRVADAEASTSDRRIVADMFLFQQDIAPAHRARDRVELLRYLLNCVTVCVICMFATHIDGEIKVVYKPHAGCRKGRKMPFLTLVTLAFDLDLQTRPNEVSNTSSV